MSGVEREELTMVMAATDAGCWEGEECCIQVLDAVLDWLAAHDAQVRAEALAQGWDEGFIAGNEAQITAYWGGDPPDDNPYRAAMEAKG